MPQMRPLRAPYLLSKRARVTVLLRGKNHIICEVVSGVGESLDRNFVSYTTWLKRLFL